MVVGESIDEHVIDERPGGRHERGVLCLPDRQPGGIVARERLDEREGVPARDLDLAHVADVEQASSGPHRQVLVGDAGVLDRHVPAGELHHPAAAGSMPGIERCFF